VYITNQLFDKAAVIMRRNKRFSNTNDMLDVALKQWAKEGNVIGIGDSWMDVRLSKGAKKKK